MAALRSANAAHYSACRGALNPRAAFGAAGLIVAALDRARHKNPAEAGAHRQGGGSHGRVVAGRHEPAFKPQEHDQGGQRDREGGIDSTIDPPFVARLWPNPYRQPVRTAIG